MPRLGGLSAAALSCRAIPTAVVLIHLLYRETHIVVLIPLHAEIESATERERHNRQTDTERERDRQTEKQRDRERERERDGDRERQRGT